MKATLTILILCFLSCKCISALQDGDISTNSSLTKYLLWTRLNPVQEQELIFDDYFSVQNSDFDNEKLTKIVVHGYTGFGTMGWVTNMRNAILQKGKYCFLPQSNLVISRNLSKECAPIYCCMSASAYSRSKSKQSIKTEPPSS